MDVDATDMPLYGEQEGRFFHGYYDSYCYLPLYIFGGDQILGARLRQANRMRRRQSGGGPTHRGAVCTAWPEVKIVLRGDSGFCREELMSWCEANRVDYVFGLARNQRLRRIIGPPMWEATQQRGATGKPGTGVQRVRLPDEEEEERRLGAGAAGSSQGRAHRRQRESAVCGDLAEGGGMGRAEALYEELYCARGEMENRIQEQFSLFADRVSSEE